MEAASAPDSSGSGCVSPSVAPEWDHDLESRSVGHRGPVNDLSSVRSSVCLGDGKAKAGAFANASRLGATREPIEQVGDELKRNASTPILDH